MVESRQGADSGPGGAKRQRLGGYELIARLGRGGMGTVFLARQIAADRSVALKILRPSLAKNREFVARFLREARAAARFNDVHIVQAIDAGHAAGYYYFAMEYVPGKNLRQRLAESGPLPERRALEVIRRIARALHTAHTESGIIHRDVKPDNILMAGDGTPKLADLGLARQVEHDDGTLTQTGVAMGTPNYISPEQVRGESDLDGRTDVYALGATLYHLLTGRPPFGDGPPAVVMARHLTEPPPDPREVNPGLSPVVSAVVRRAMAKAPADRYPTAASLADDLDAILAGTAPEPRPAPTIRARRRVRRAAQRRKRPWIVAGVVLASAAALLAAVLLTAGPSDDPGTAGGLPDGPDRPRELVAPAQEARDIDPSAETPVAPVPRRQEKPKPDPEAVRRRAADAAFASLCAETARFAKTGDYDGALALLGDLPPEFADLLSARAVSERGRLAEQAKEKIRSAVTQAEVLGKEGDPAAGLAALRKLSAVKYRPLDGEREAARRRLAEQLRTLQKAERERELAAAEEAVKRLLAANFKLYEAAEERRETLKDAEYDKLRERYEPELVRLKGEYDRLSDSIRAKYRILRNTPRRHPRHGGEFFDHVRRRVRDGIAADRERQAEVKEQMAGLVKTVRREKARITERDEQREKQMKAVCDAHRAALATPDHGLSEADMAARYNEALGVK
jgi:serine/threonine-protein kinase